MVGIACCQNVTSLSKHIACVVAFNKVQIQSFRNKHFFKHNKLCHHVIIVSGNNFMRPKCSGTFIQQQQINDQWSTCFLPDTQLPCDNINVKVYIYGQVYVQATLTNRSLLSKWLRYNTYQLKLEPIIIWYMTSYEINKIPKMHHITISL